ncbi:MAG: UpxY family transcription antiterminator [Bacteroidales bacterium]|nr:UpxY family transcription antiterminator [Bacteroidales bacterium]
MSTTTQTPLWYVARTRHGMELGVRNRLESLGVQNFVPVRKRPAYRGKKMVEEPMLSCMVFLRATKDEALDLIHYRGVKADYLQDCATHSLMVIPDKVMSDFMRVFDLSVAEGGLVDRPLNIGDRVRVTKGVLKGVEGYVLELQGEYYVVVGLMDCLYARARVPRAWLEMI